jgi:hypothetical protein
MLFIERHVGSIKGKPPCEQEIWYTVEVDGKKQTKRVGRGKETTDRFTKKEVNDLLQSTHYIQTKGCKVMI